MNPSFEFENQHKGLIVCGIDEAGLGPLAGPLVVSSCHIKDMILPNELLENINDSKKLSPKKRAYLFEKIIDCPNIAYKVSIIENSEIDSLGIAKAWAKAIRDSVAGMPIDICLIDGNRNVEIPSCQTFSIVKGDQKSFSIATASIIAKVTRDRIMMQIHDEFPQYGFNKHVGYGTKQHMEAIFKYGPCKYHRLSYAPFSKNSLVNK